MLFRTTMPFLIPLLLSSWAMSATLSTAGTIVSHTREGLNSPDNQGASTTNHNFELGAVYTANDLLTLAYSVPLDSETPYSPPSQILCDGRAVNTDSVLFGLLSTNLGAGTLIYRVVTTDNGSADPSFDTVGLHCVLPSVRLSDTDLALNDTATVTVSTMTTSGRFVESASAIVANVVDAFDVSVNQAFDAVVDVGQFSKAFVGGAPIGSTDTLTITPSQNGNDGDVLAKVAYSNNTVSAAAAHASPVISSIEYSVIGDFSFLDIDPVQPGMQLGSNTVIASNGSVTFSDDLTSLTVRDADLTLNASNLVLTKGEEDKVIVNQTFTGNFLVSSSSGHISSNFSFAPGAWGWNGSSITVFTVPFTENVVRRMLVSNQGAGSADIVASVIYEGITYGSYSLGAVGAGSIKDVSAELDQQIYLAGDTIGLGRANIIFKVSGSATNIVVFGSYQTDTNSTSVTLATSAQTLLVTP